MFIVPMSGLCATTAKEEGKATLNSSQAQVPFADVFKEAVQNLKETDAVSKQDAYDLALGKVDDLHNVSINTAKAEMALALTVQLTTRAVSAYNEVMRMQV